jgi:hypothetical protein
LCLAAMFLTKHPRRRSDVKKLSDAALTLFGPFIQSLDELFGAEKTGKCLPRSKTPLRFLE